MKNKGFTLIELLAVILVVAAISTIAIAKTVNVMDNTKRSSFEEGTYGLINSAQIYFNTISNKLDENEQIIFTCDGTSCKNSSNSSLKFSGKIPISGEVIISSPNQYKLVSITDGTYCATGTSTTLKVAKDCESVDDTAAILDSKKIISSSTTNSIKLILNDGFAIDKQSGISKYNYEISKDGKIIESVTKKENEVTFSKLQNNTKYDVKITVTNGNNLISSVTTNVYTKQFLSPTITSTSDALSNGYVKKQTISIKYNHDNVSNPSFYIKTTRSGKSSIDVTQSCGTGLVFTTCNNITSTKVLNSNTWYKVSDNLNIIYDDETTTSTDSIVAVLSDGNNNTPASTLTLSKLDKTIPTVSYSISGGTLVSSNTNGGTYNLTSAIYLKINGDDSLNYDKMEVQIYKNGSLLSTIKNNSKINTVNLTTGIWSIRTKVYDSAGQIQNKTPDTSGYYYQTYTIQENSKSQKCGYDSCRTQGCGVESYNSCRAQACGVAAWNTCSTPACGVAAWNTCTTSACGTYQVCRNVPRGCQSEACGCGRNVDGSEGPDVWPGYCQMGIYQYKWCIGKDPYCVDTVCDNYNYTCSNPNCGVAAYNSCATSACGVAYYNYCQTPACGIKTYKYCQNSACGYKTCWHS